MWKKLSDFYLGDWERSRVGTCRLPFTLLWTKEAGLFHASGTLWFQDAPASILPVPPKVNDTRVTQSHQRGPYACLPALFSGSLAVGWSPNLSTHVYLLLTSPPSSQFSCPSDVSSRQPSSSHQHPISHHHGTDIDILEFEANVMTELSKTGWDKTRQSWDSQN